MFKKYSLKKKIFMMLIPLGIGFLISSALVIENYHKQGKEMEGLAIVSDLFVNLGDLIHELQIERGKTTQYLAKTLELSDLQKQRSLIVDKSILLAQKTIAKLPFPASDTKDLQARIAELERTRAKVDARQINVLEVITNYSQIIHKLITFEGTAMTFYSGKGIELRFITANAIETLKEAIGKARGSYTAIFAADTAISSPDDLRKYEAIRSGIKIAANSPALEQVPELLVGQEWNELSADMEMVSTKSTTGAYGVDSKAFFEKISQVINNYNFILKNARKEILAEIQLEKKKASQSLWIVLIVFIVFASGASIFSYLITRDIVATVDEIVIELTDGGEIVAKAANDIFQSSTALASNVVEQATALQETVSSLDEISAMISLSTDNASRSQDVAIHGNTSAENGRQAVIEMISAMGEISQSNSKINQQIEHTNKQLSEIVAVISKIGEKTKVINDIVFQTKLLSFNASVEAARAGEHGKGFSVVAEEIGSLAQMSGNAAKEISEMLANSIKSVEVIASETKEKIERLLKEAKGKVTTGSNIAERCGQSLNEIVANVNEINRMVVEIVNATKEQAQGIQGIHTAMEQLDRVTQQNSSVAQSISNATEEQNRQSQSLHRIVTTLYTTIRGENKI